MSENKHSIGDLMQFQSLPLSIKISMTKRRIIDWYDNFYGDVFVSFSGGKDSTVLLNIARQIYPNIEAVFVNTGLEYPEIQQFVKSFENVTVLYPKMRFNDVIKKYGYPVISKEVSKHIYYARKAIAEGRENNSHDYKLLCGLETDKQGNKSIFNCEKYKPLLNVDFNISDMCCNVMKKSPIKQYCKSTGKKMITAQMANESRLRTQQWLKNGCNGFDMKNPVSNPMSFWTEQDILEYLKIFNIPFCTVYGDIVFAKDSYQTRFSDFGIDGLGNEKLKTTGCDRTGCCYCAFGCHLDGDISRFERLKLSHPKQYQYCIGGGEYDSNNIWKPNNNGLGLGHVFDELNKIYGDGFIKY